MQGEEGEDEEGEMLESSGLHRINEERIIMEDVEDFKYEEDDVDR